MATYRPTPVLTGLICVLLGLSAVLHFIGVVTIRGQIQLVEGGAHEIEGLATQGLAHLALLGLMAGTSLVTACLFFVWTWRSVQNLHDLELHGIRFSALGAVAWFFVPIFQIFRPYQVFHELWTNSGPSSGRRGGAGPVSFWWAAWLGSWTLIFCASVFLVAARSQVEVARSLYCLAVGEVVSILAAIGAASVVYGVHARQAALVGWDGAVREGAVHERRSRIESPRRVARVRTDGEGSAPMAVATPIADDRFSVSCPCGAHLAVRWTRHGRWGHCPTCREPLFLVSI